MLETLLQATREGVAELSVAIGPVDLDVIAFGW
jgi:hypothetical protein